MRLALGATARQLVTLVVRQALTPVLVGALLGVGAAFASGRVLDSLLFEIGPADPGSFGAATVLLLGIALLASYVPARRASRADRWRNGVYVGCPSPPAAPRGRTRS